MLRRRWTMAALGTVLTGVLTVTAPAQLPRKGTKPAPTAAPAAAEPVPVLEVKKHLVSPNEPIAVVNGEAISRQQLADECVAQKGAEVLESLIARRLIDQGLRAKKLQVTPQEVNAEIDRIADTIGGGVSREQWLKTLSEQRKISPDRYARDVIYPMLALKKLATPLVQVTEQDLKDAIEAQYGERVRCRMILFNSLPHAMQAWEDLKKAPHQFEKLAQERSIDPATRAVGGMLPEPIVRNAQPTEVSNKIFAQLVDATEGEAASQPKDGDMTGVIQITEATWGIFQRDSLIPARPVENDPLKQKQLKEALFDAKVQQMMGEVLTNMIRDSAIENLLTGQVKLSREEEMHAPADAQVQRSGAKVPAPTAPAPAPAAAAPAVTQPLRTGVAPPGVPADAFKKPATRK